MVYKQNGNKIRVVRCGGGDALAAMLAKPHNEDMVRFTEPVNPLLFSCGTAWGTCLRELCQVAAPQRASSSKPRFGCKTLLFSIFSLGLLKGQMTCKDALTAYDVKSSVSSISTPLAGVQVSWVVLNGPW